MSIEAIELMGERDRQTYADILAAELQKPPAPLSSTPLFERLNGVAMRVTRRQDEHGTMASYDHGGCRCAACRQAGLEHRAAKRRVRPPAAPLAVVKPLTVAPEAPALPMMRPILKPAVSGLPYERMPLSNQDRLRAAAAEAI